ncbi:leucine--tRNA ligase [Patescibacteria group bacterium]|nr:leucine--tRNA ligase [Patescibacteria group bacterium]
MEKYNHTKIEKKWQKEWEKQELYKTDEESDKKKFYILDMYPYPSGEGLHVGHVVGYTATDIYTRFKRMNGFNVLHPMGWDAFGLPAENYAIKTGMHPKDTTQKTTDIFRKQIQHLGLSYDWSREISTHRPEYYRWTQWFFLLLYENGLAERKFAKVNWCESCKTVLANEQVLSGFCERCKNEIVQKNLEQWFFKITEFADALIDDLDDVDWPQSTVINQRNWIGKSEGAEIEFRIQNSEFRILVFTTRVDTLFGVTYIVLAPEHPLVAGLLQDISNKKEVEAYVKETSTKTELERTAESKEKNGVELRGVKAINPANKKEIPIFVANYVLTHYGTGAIMAVPAHDERDFEFAKKVKLSIVEVVRDKTRNSKAGGVARVYTGSGQLVNSGKFDGMDSGEAQEKILAYVKGKKKTTYKLRDWLVSRQRYWGAPIPIVYDKQGKPHSIPKEYLPWLLPTDVEFKPTGISPLAESKELRGRVENIFGKGWRPEVDTMDTFVCSSWYFFRFADPKNEKEFASHEQIKKWLPVDLYMGGAEHTVLHLMYARFFTKVLEKLKYIDFKEPFSKLRHQGMILAEDGRKMSKSLGNITNPDEIVERFGADTMRIYEMFMGPLADSKPWNTQNIMGARRFIERIWRLQIKVKNQKSSLDKNKELDTLLHQTIKKVGSDIENLKFNTAISQMMILVNALEKATVVNLSSYKILVQLVAPFAPHVAEELWQKMGGTDSVHKKEWPQFDESHIIAETYTIVVQINGKVRAKFEASTDLSEAQIKEKSLSMERIRKCLSGKKPQRIIYVFGKIVNIVV